MTWKCRFEACRSANVVLSHSHITEYLRNVLDRRISHWKSQVKKYLVAGLAVLSMCCAPAPIPPPNHVVDSAAVTVALMVPRGDGYGPTCGGVWVADEWILTANHCVMDEDELGDSVKVNTMKFIMSPMHPKLFDSDVVYRQPEQDLALLKAKTWQMHTFAGIASESPAVGSNVHVVGHPIGLLWTYLTGQVAQNRKDLEKFGQNRPFLQLQVPITHGNSGGGAFDDNGLLVGIADLSASSLPSEGFFIPVEAIIPFLKESHIR